jgi:hypothetical protein
LRQTWRSRPQCVQASRKPTRSPVRSSTTASHAKQRMPRACTSRDGSASGPAVQFPALSADTAGVQDSERPLPLYSKLIDDPNSGDAIDEFVVGVAERVDHLQDADSRRDFAELGKLACELALDARDAGFDLLAEVARAVQAACLEGSKKPAHDGVVAVTDLAYRIRLGHRGAMS